MIICEYRNQDREKCLELFEKVYQRTLTKQFWDWRYSKLGRPIRYLAWEEDQIVGHYVVHPIPFKIFDHVENILFSMTVMVHPDFRGRNLFQELAEYVYEDASKRNYKLVIGFPNKNSEKIHFQKLGWKNFGNPPEYFVEVNNLKNNQNKELKFDIKQIKRFDNEVDELWKKFEKNYNYIVPRNSTYLNWRFVDYPRIFKNDNSEYFFFLLKDNDKLLSYFILKKFNNEKCHLVDYFGFLDSSIINFILIYSLKFCNKNNLRFFSFWPSFIGKKNKVEINPKFYFKIKNSESIFGIKLLDDNLKKTIFDKTQWYLTMGDSDIF